MGWFPMGTYAEEEKFSPLPPDCRHDVAMYFRLLLKDRTRFHHHTLSIQIAPFKAEFVKYFAAAMRKLINTT